MGSGQWGAAWATGGQSRRRRAIAVGEDDHVVVADGVINDKKCCSSAGDGLGAGRAKWEQPSLLSHLIESYISV